MPAFLEFATDGTTAWAGSQITITCGGAPDTWDYDTEIGTDGCSVYEAIVNIAAWANDHASRPWGGLYLFSSAFPYHADTGQMGAGLVCFQSVTYAPDAQLQALFEWAAQHLRSILCQCRFHPSSNMIENQTLENRSLSFTPKTGQPLKVVNVV